MSDNLKQSLSLVFLFSILLALSAHAIAKSYDTVELEKNESLLISFKQTSYGWQSKSNSKTFEIEKTGNTYQFKSGSLFYTLKIKDDKYKLYNIKDVLVFKIKEKEGKIKISQSEEDPNPWILKLSDNEGKYKVEKSGAEIGKVKYYPDDGKLKAKDDKDNVLCSMKYNHLSIAPAVCLINGISEEERLVLFTMLMLIGK
ncbi:secreted protein [Candidatus Magnetoovum chiemensis]|nr:secreted protein [Candidatus Magnetoovum chiemensis]